MKRSNDMNRPEECIVLVLGEQLHISMVAAGESGQLIVGSTSFNDRRLGSFMGFHDWLRKSLPPRILGVRFWPHEKSYLPDSDLLGKPYLASFDGGKGVGVFFCTDKNYDPHLSGDQSFCFNKVMFSEKNDVALVLDTRDLTSDEFRSIEQEITISEAKWITDCQTS